MDLEAWGGRNWEWLVTSMDGSEDGRVEPLGAAAGTNLVLSVLPNTLYKRTKKTIKSQLIRKMRNV